MDRAYAFLEHADELGHAVFIHGFDFDDEEQSYRAVVARNASVVVAGGETTNADSATQTSTTGRMDARQ